MRQSEYKREYYLLHEQETGGLYNADGVFLNKADLEEKLKAFLCSTHYSRYENITVKKLHKVSEEEAAKNWEELKLACLENGTLRLIEPENDDGESYQQFASLKEEVSEPMPEAFYLLKDVTITVSVNE